MYDVSIIYFSLSMVFPTQLTVYWNVEIFILRISRGLEQLAGNLRLCIVYSVYSRSVILRCIAKSSNQGLHLLHGQFYPVVKAMSSRLINIFTTCRSASFESFIIVNNQGFILPGESVVSIIRHLQFQLNHYAQKQRSTWSSVSYYSQ